MSLLHDMSEECVHAELDLFTIPMTQTAIEKNAYVEVPPISAISGMAPLEFFIAGNGEDYIDLNNTLVYLSQDHCQRGQCRIDKLSWCYYFFPG